MKILGHRGTGITMRETSSQAEMRRRDGKYGPENTLKAFELALRGGADGLEIDVYRTADNDLAVIHDDALNLHVPGADKRGSDKGFVSRMTMDALRKVDVGDGQGIPSLRDVFAMAAKHNYPVLNIELAGKDTYALAYTQARDSRYPLDRIIFSSFDHEQLVKLRCLDTTVKIGLLFDRQLPVYGAVSGKPLTEKYIKSVLRTIWPTSIHPYIRNVSDDLIKFAKAHRLDIYAWTAREKHPAQDTPALKFARRFKEDKNIHLITDFPSEIKALIP